MKSYTYNYTYSELIEKLSSLNNEDFVYPDRRSSINGSEEFCLTSSLEEAMGLARYGWKDSNTIKDISYNLENLIDTVQLKDSFLYDVSGDEPEVSRFLANEPENMLVFIQEEVIDHKQVHLLVNCTFSSSVSTQIIYNRGAVVLTLISKLEDLGYRVKLDVCNIVESDDRDVIRHIIQIKDYFEQVDLDRIAFCLCHPSFFRRILFGICESYSKEIVKTFKFYTSGGYGYPSDDTIGCSYTLYISSIDQLQEHNYIDLDSCIHMVQKQITEIIHKKNSY